jgi:hypothetical protein
LAAVPFLPSPTGFSQQTAWIYKRRLSSPTTRPPGEAWIQTLTTGTFVRRREAIAKGSSSSSSVISRAALRRMAAKATPASTHSATTVAAPMPSQNHTAINNLIGIHGCA